jgi:hypothetical protein
VRLPPPPAHPPHPACLPPCLHPGLRLFLRLQCPPSPTIPWLGDSQETPPLAAAPCEGGRVSHGGSSVTWGWGKGRTLQCGQQALPKLGSAPKLGVHTRTLEYMRVCSISTHRYTCMHTPEKHTWNHICVHTHRYTCTDAHKHACTYTHTHTRRLHTHWRVLTYVCTDWYTRGHIRATHSRGYMHPFCGWTDPAGPFHRGLRRLLHA